MSDREVFTRRSLPHWYMPYAAHFITYRLAGTIPIAALKSWRADRDRILAGSAGNRDLRERAHKLFFASYDRYLDQNRRIDWLADEDVAAIVQENLYFHHAKRYRLLVYCIMPNHVHILLQPTARNLPPRRKSGGPAPLHADEKADRLSPLSHIMHRLKSYTASAANKLLARKGQFWQHESFDHWVRDDGELERIANYIRQNSVAAGLVKSPEDWVFSSAHDRFDFDGDRTAWLDEEAAHNRQQLYMWPNQANCDELGCDSEQTRISHDSELR
jgi:putative DNA methylase